jgi:DNA-binding transcriptional regulator GbsR (MarR family)
MTTPLSGRDNMMDDPASVPEREKPETDSHANELVREFVEHWGMMARAWGINPTMGELFALLYITGSDWTADELRDRLRISRGNVSMNLRELLSWGVVRKLHRQGERRELFRAEADVWMLFKRILKERKRRELDPTLTVLDRIFQLAANDPELSELRSRVERLCRFFDMIETLSTRLLSFDPRELADFGQVFASGEDSITTVQDQDGKS